MVLILKIISFYGNLDIKYKKMFLFLQSNKKMVKEAFYTCEPVHEQGLMKNLRMSKKKVTVEPFLSTIEMCTNART